MAENNSISHDWTDLGESKVIGVVLGPLQEKYESLECISCQVDMSDAVVKSPDDYIGVFPMGSTDENSCVLNKKIGDNQTRKYEVVIKPAGIPASFSGNFQLAYVGADGVFYGKSSSFFVDQAPPESSVVDEDFLIIDPPLEEVTIPYEEYKKVLDRVVKLEEENETLMNNLAFSQKRHERAVIELEQVFARKTSNQDQDIARLLTDKTMLIEVKDRLNSKLDTLSEENTQLKSCIKSQKDMVKAFLNAQSEKPAEKKEASPHSSPKGSPVGTANFLQNELSDHECMIRALEDSKKLCLEELQNEKRARLAIEGEIEKLKNEYKVLLEKYTSLLEHKNQETKLMICKLNTLQDDMRSSRDELNKKLEDLNAENKTLIVASESLEEHVKYLKNMNESLSCENEELKKQANKSDDSKVDGIKEIEDMKIRLEEAAELYKRQFVEIHNLKKIAKRYEKSAKEQDKDVKPANSGEKREDSPQSQSVASRAAVPTNDSDTGETVSSSSDVLDMCYGSVAGAASEDKIGKTEAKKKPMEEPYSIPCVDLLELGPNPSLKSSESWPEFYIVTCPSCTEVFPVVNHDNTTLQTHLSMVHNQQLCPLCYMVFDGTVASSAMKGHVETHFAN